MIEASSLLTKLFRRWNEGDATAGEKLVPLVYNELRRILVDYSYEPRVFGPQP